MSAITFLSGCEANLDLSAVEDSKKNPIARYDHYQAIAKSDKSIVVIGNRGALLTSVDQGVSWTRQVLPGDQSISYPTLLDIDICPDNRFIVLDANRKVWISDAEGGNWVAKNITTEEEVLDLTCALDGTIWVVGSFTLIMDSHDGGNSWTDKSIAEDAMFSRIQFIDRQNGVVTGEFGSVYKTTDGGETWKAANMIPNEFYPMASLFITTEEGWVGGLQGIIFHTNDGGQNWHRQETGTKAPIYNIFDVAGEIYAIGEQGTLLTLAGNGWRSVEINLGFGYLRGALALSNGKFLVVGGGGLIRLLDQHKL
ncbi:MAG: hypothetical protein JKY45_12565 [Emcibacter sp.]|nr:hypothetical protein [Emcibacter sp.]